MSELKAMTVLNVLQMGSYDNVLVYFKSEADKVIADLEESHKKEVEQLLMEIMKLKHSLELASNECCFISERGVKNARHHKYKRCLAMAKWCCEAYDKWMMKKAKAIGLGKDGVEEYHQARRKLFHYMRWQKRWLELAEKFKPNN